MIAMRMRDDDMVDALAFCRIDKRRDVSCIVGTGIEDRDLSVADNVGARAGEGERPGIGRKHAADQRRDLLHLVRFRIEVAFEGDIVVGHVCSGREKITSRKAVASPTTSS